MVSKVTFEDSVRSRGYIMCKVSLKAMFVKGGL